MIKKCVKCGYEWESDQHDEWDLEQLCYQCWVNKDDPTQEELESRF